jgi:hypothetical protein
VPACARTANCIPPAFCISCARPVDIPPTPSTRFPAHRAPHTKTAPSSAPATSLSFSPSLLPLLENPLLLFSSTAPKILN